MKIGLFKDANGQMGVDLIGKATDTKRGSKSVLFLKLRSILAACLLLVILVGIGMSIFINERNKNLVSSIMTFNNLKYELIQDTGKAKTIIEKYKIPNTITINNIGDFVGYVGGRTGSGAPSKTEAIKLFYIKQQPTLDILILQDKSGVFSYIISENLDESTFNNNN